MKRTIAIIAGVTIFLIFVAFGRSLFQGFAPLDDDLLIAFNLSIRGLTWENLKTVFTTYDPELYIPLTFVSYQINYVIAGLAPWIYHLTNMFLHVGNSLLLMWVLLLLTKGTAVLRPYIIVFAGLIFAVHPLNTEAVVWLAGRKDLLSTFFFLGAWGMYIWYRNGGVDSRVAPTRAYVLSVALFTCAVLSKIMAVTLPAVLMLTDLLIERRSYWGKGAAMLRPYVDKIPYALLSGIFLIVATTGKERIIANHSMMETALMAAKSTAFYLQKFLLPVHLGVFYPYRGEISLTEPAILAPVLIVLALLSLVIFSAGRRPTLVFGALFFITTLAPTFINFHKGGEMYFASDRYPYLPMIGLVFLVAMIIVCMTNKDAPLARPYNHSWIWIPGMGIIAILTTLSFFQTKIWDSPQSLFGNTLRLYPGSVAARVALASMDKQMGRYEQAIKLLRDGLAYGDNLQLRMGLGSVYAKVGRVNDAADQFQQALKLEPDNPEPLVGLGVLDEYNKKIPAAMEKYRKAVALDPSYVSARNKLGSLLLEGARPDDPVGLGKIEEAEGQFRAALEWNPNADGVLYNLSLVLDAKGKPEEALQLLQKAHALNPDSVAITDALEEHLQEHE